MTQNDPYQIKYLNAFPSYLENQASKPFYHTNSKQNLETIAFSSQQKGEMSPLERIFSDKTKTLKSTVKALLTEIELRESLNCHIVYKINDDLCRQHTGLLNLENIKTQYSFEFARSVHKSKSQLENNVVELEQEKRKEYLECWRDLMFLKKYLHSALKEYWDSVKKSQLLEGDLS